MSKGWFLIHPSFDFTLDMHLVLCVFDGGEALIMMEHWKEVGVQSRIRVRRRSARLVICCVSEQGRIYRHHESTFLSAVTHWVAIRGLRRNHWNWNNKQRQPYVIGGKRGSVNQQKTCLDGESYVNINEIEIGIGFAVESADMQMDLWQMLHLFVFSTKQPIKFTCSWNGMFY